MKKFIVILLSCLIPFKYLRKSFRNTMLAESASNKNIYKEIKLLNYKLDLIMNHYIDIKTARPATGILRANQIKRFNALKSTAELLEKNNVDYWLDFGTLLGAVRHQGWIPWDNDIDIAVNKKDWSKVINLVGGGIRDNSTLKFVDMSELCDVKKETILTIIDTKENIHLLDIYSIIENPKNPDTLIHEYMLKNKNPMQFRKETIYPLATANFEDITFKIPGNYDRYLNIIYGDYNIFPQSIRDDAEFERKLKIKDI